jgi:anaerobic magnesium-protoporphyrin IX monomethyl ester cyclase
MKILLINPSLREANIGHYDEAAEKQRGIYPPLGLCYIGAVLEKEKHQVKIIDCDAEEAGLSKIKEEMEEYKPDLVGIYVMTWTFGQAKDIAILVKSIDKKVQIVAGGPNITCMPRQSLKYGNFDFGVVGEGELTIVELINVINENKSNYEGIKGLVFRRGEEIVVNGSRPLVGDIDSIPFPSRHLMPIKKYYDVFTRKKYFATLIATRGCPFNCTFCDRENRMGKNWRVRSPKNIVDEIEEINSKYDIKEFMFFDDNLLVNKDWSLKLCKEIIDRRLNIIWECRARADMLTDETVVKTLKKAGCYRIRVGFESGDNEILKVIKKGITTEQSRKCAETCKKAGIEIFGYFMMGSPEETKETLQKTLDLAMEINPSFALFSKTVMIPGSELFEWGVGKGYISKDYWERFLRGEEKNGAPTIDTPKLPEAEVDRYIKLANKKFYLRPTYMIKKLLAIRSPYQFWRQVEMAKSFLLKR